MRKAPFRRQAPPYAEKLQLFRLRARRYFEWPTVPLFPLSSFGQGVDGCAVRRKLKTFDVIDGELGSEDFDGITCEKERSPDGEQQRGGKREGNPAASTHESTLDRGGDSLGRAAAAKRVGRARPKSGASGAHDLSRHALTGDTIAARAARLEMRVNRRPIRRCRLFVDVGSKKRFDLSATRFHTTLAFGRRDSPRVPVRRSKSIRRPREMRDMTVPIGTSIIFAMSA